MKYDVYFTDLTHTGIGVNSRAFPLGIGVVAAYAAKEFDGQLEIDLFKFPDDFNRALQKKIPHLLCMSNYCYNSNLSYAFARHIKRRYPNVIVIFGGPNIPAYPKGKMAFLKRHPMIDFYIKWAGEVALVNLLRKLFELNLSVERFKKQRIISENCCYLIGDDYVEGPDHHFRNLGILPSPYTMGLLDKFFVPPLNPTFETTRGCPYSCTFCNEGNTFKSKLFRKPPEIVAEELEYIASRIHKTAELWLCDDNFGMYKEDIETSHIISSTIKKYGWPLSFQAVDGKSHPERILETRRIINQHQDGALRFGASLQSTDPGVLRNIKRKNLPFEKLIKLSEAKLSQNNSKTNYFTELILALPGDSLEKHYRSLQDSIDNLGMCNIDIHQLNLLHGAALADSDDISKYKMNIRYRVFVGCLGIYRIGSDQVPCAEIDKMVVGNSTLSFDDYIECRIMNLLVKMFVDHDPFREVLGFIRKLNLSVFELLCVLKDKFLYTNDSLSNLIADFVEKTKKPLFKNKDELEEFVSQEKTIKKYISGELGGNELLNSKAKAFLQYSNVLHSVLRESTLFYLKKHNLLTKEYEDYINQAIQFSQLRKFDIHNINTIKYGDFTFDFIKAAQSGYQADPSQIKITRTQFKFVHDPESLDYIQKRLGCWDGNTLTGIGKLFQKTNMELMSRKVYPENA